MGKHLMMAKQSKLLMPQKRLYWACHSNVVQEKPRKPGFSAPVSVSHQF